MPDGTGDDTQVSSARKKWKNTKTTSLLRANDKLSKVGIVHYTVYDGRGIWEMSFEAFLGPIFCKIEA